MPVPSWTSSDFLSAFLKLLPRGRAWAASQGGGVDSVQAKALAPLMPVYERQAARAAYLLVDAFPLTTVELLPEWEESLGLPDPCVGASPTIEERRAQVVARFIASGGQSVAYFVGMAATLGYAITITQFTASRFGRLFGQPFGGEDWAHAWQVNAPQFTVRPFQFGTDAFGEPFASWDNTVLQCESQRLKPAHTTLIFNYG